MNEPDADAKKAYEQRLQRRLKILKEQFDAGKVKIAPGLRVIDSLKAVRYSADGAVDLSTVDGLVRSMALVAEHVHDREELKSALPLATIQNTYFEFLDKNFGEFYKVMRARGMSPHDAGIALSRNEKAAEELIRGLPEFIETIEEFWRGTADAVHAHVEDMHDALKGIFGGDLFPSHAENIASKCGIYADTLLLPDPFLRSKTLFDRWNTEKRAYYLIKHGLNLLQYKDLACVDVSPPIVVVLPDLAELENGEKQFFYGLGQRDALIHAARVFGKQFVSFEELMKFAESLDSVDRVMANVADPSRVLFDTEWEGSFREKLVRASGDQHAELLGTTNPGIIVASQAVGRMSISNELLTKAGRLGAIPIIDAPTSWQYFVWKLEYDAENVERETQLANLHIVRGLQTLAENEMQWLGRVPPKALIEVRKTGAIAEIRSILGKGISEISHANPTNFHRTSDRVLDNIHTAFDDHKKALSELTAKGSRDNNLTIMRGRVLSTRA